MITGERTLCLGPASSALTGGRPELAVGSALLEMNDG